MDVQGTSVWARPNNDFDLDNALDPFIGLQLWSGMFLELKGTSCAAPAKRLVIGYNF